MSESAGELFELLGNEDAAFVEAQAWTFEQKLLVARLLFHAGRVGEADRLLRPLIRADRDHRELLKIWAQIKHTQGQLTEAVHAFARLHAVEPQTDSVLGAIGEIHRCAQFATKREPELDLVADSAIARMHRARSELESAFRLAAAQKFTSAIKVCDAVADRHRAFDAQIYKLACLVKCILLESVGQLDRAIEALEYLGRTRGFELDNDRMITLAGAYERRGTHDDLGRAMKLFVHLFERTRSAEYLSRMARLAERAGLKEEAAEFDRQFMTAFHEEQGELEIREILEAALLRWVPIATLRELLHSEEPLDAPPGHDQDRKRAILLALRGEHRESESVWRTIISRGGVRPEDLKYLAELLEGNGDVKGAHKLLLAALSEEEVADGFVLGRLLADPERAPAENLRALFSDREKAEHTLEGLRHMAKGNQLSPESWSTLARFERLIGRDDDAERHTKKATALERVHSRSTPRIGHVQVAAIYEFKGKKHGLVHEIWANRYAVNSKDDEGGQLDEASIFGNVAHDMMRDIQNVFVAVRVFVQQKFPHLVEDLDRYRYVLKVTKDDEPSGGVSAGAAVALAFLSVFLQKSVPNHFAITGSLVADSSSEIRINRVADIDHKVLGTYHRKVPLLIAPAENRVDLELSHVVPRSFWESRVAFARNLTQVMKLVFGDDVWEW